MDERRGEGVEGTFEGSFAYLLLDVPPDVSPMSNQGAHDSPVQTILASANREKHPQPRDNPLNLQAAGSARYAKTLLVWLTCPT